MPATTRLSATMLRDATTTSSAVGLGDVLPSDDGGGTTVINGADGTASHYQACFDEVFERDGTLRPHYHGLFDRLQAMAPPELVRRAGLRDAIFRRLGITFAVYGEQQGIERTWPMDLIPRIIRPGGTLMEVEHLERP